MVDVVTRAAKGAPLTFAEMDGNFTSLKAAVDQLMAKVFPPTPTVTLSGAQSQPEGNSGSTLFTYTVTRSVTSGGIQVPWSFAAGTTDASDYTGGTLPVGGNVSIADGQNSGTIVISVAGDTTVEPDETFTVSIAPPVGYAAGVAMSASGTILNDDLPALTLGGALAFTTSTVAGTTVATISNVPAGVTPTLTPNDGRLVIAGNSGSGWKVVVGMTAASTGPIALSVSATGTTGASATVTVSLPTPSITPLPGGMSALWDATSLTTLADGAAVTSWTDSIGSSVATPTSDSTTVNTFVANSGGGIPAVRTSGLSVLATTGTNTANTAMTGADHTMIVIARNFQGKGTGQALPGIASSGTDGSHLLLADSTSTGSYGSMTGCADAGMRSIGLAKAGVAAAAYVIVNGAVIRGAYDANAGGQVAIGGFQNVGQQCGGKADIIAVLIWPRTLTVAETVQVHRHYCDLLGQAYPGGATARHVVFAGDSQTVGVALDISQSYPYQLSTGLALPYGTWHNLAISGKTWPDVQNQEMPLLGNLSAVTGTRNIVCVFEWANMKQTAAADVATAAQTVINALHAQDPNRDVILGSSLDDGTPTGVSSRSNRQAYNALLDNPSSRPTGIAAYVAMHNDPNIGVVGCCPTDGTANTYFQNDNLHPTAAGYALLDNGPYGFRAAVQARLAASAQPTTSLAITSPASLSQPGATQRFFQATANQPVTWAISAGFTIDPATGVWSVTTANAGAAPITAAVTKTPTITATSTGGSASVTQTVTLTLNPTAAPSQSSESYQSDFTGTAGRRLETLPGWALYTDPANTSPPTNSNVATDGSGDIASDGTGNTQAAVLYSPSALANQTTHYQFKQGNYSGGLIRIFVAANGYLNGVGLQVSANSDALRIVYGRVFQGGAQPVNPGIDGTAVNYANGVGDMFIVGASDGKSITITMVGANTVSRTIDLTSYVRGAKFGLSGASFHDALIDAPAILPSMSYVIPDTTLTITSAPIYSATNVATYQVTQTGPAATGYQVRFVDSATNAPMSSWMTADATINSDQTATVTATAPGAGPYVAQIRALNDIPVVAVAPNPTRFLANTGALSKFGTNLVNAAIYDPQFQIYNNLMQIGDWQDTSNGYAYATASQLDANGMPLVNNLERGIGHGPVSGNYLQLTWTGSPGMTIQLPPTGTSTVYSGLTYPTPQSAQFMETFTYGGPSTYGGIVFGNIDVNNPPKNIQLVAVGQAAPQHPPFADAFIDLEKGFTGPIRALDYLNTNSNVDGSSTWATRTLPGMLFKKNGAGCIEYLITLANATSRDLWINVPPYCADGYTTALMQALDTGAGTTNGIGLNPGLKIWVEDSNEVWNSKFPIYSLAQTKFQQRTGASAPSSGAVGAGYVVQEHAWRHNHLMTLVEAAIPSYATRVMRVVNTQMGAAYYQLFKSYGGAHCDANAQAPYFYHPYTSGDPTTPAALAPLWKQAGISALASCAPSYQDTKADGKRYVTYECGPSFDSAQIDPAVVYAFKASPQYYDVMKSYFNYWAVNYGDTMMFYNDIGGLPNGVENWGLISYQGQTNAYGLLAIQDAIAGTTAHAPS